MRTQRGGKKETKTVLPFSNGTVVIPLCMFSNNIPPPMPWQVGLHYPFHVHSAPAVKALHPIPYIPTRRHGGVPTHGRPRAKMKQAAPGSKHGPPQERFLVFF